MVLGAVSKLAGGTKSKPSVYVMLSLPDGLKLSNIPVLNGTAGADTLPVLVKGAKLGYSTFNGTIANLNLPFVKEDLMKAMAGLGNEFGAEKLLSMVANPELRTLTELKDAAMRGAASAVSEVSKSVPVGQTLIDVAGSDTLDHA